MLSSKDNKENVILFTVDTTHHKHSDHFMCKLKAYTHPIEPLPTVYMNRVLHHLTCKQTLKKR